MGKGMVFSALGVEFAVVIFAAYYIGNIIDKKMGWQGSWAVIGLTLAFFIAWLVRFIYMVKKFAEDERTAQKNDNSDSRFRP